MRSDWYDKVKRILENYEDARDDDFILYLLVCKIYTDAPTFALSFEDALEHHVKYGLPSYESVTRARRKVKEDYTHLRGRRYKGRKDEQERYREFYGGEGK